MRAKIKAAWIVLVVTAVAVGIVVTGDLGPGHQAQAKEAEQAVSAAGASDNQSRGRKPVAIVDGQ